MRSITFLSIHVDAATRAIRSVPTNSHYRIEQQSQGRRSLKLRNEACLSVIEVFAKEIHRCLLNYEAITKE